MATDLLEYAQQTFPSHHVAPWRDDGSGLVLQSHTLVVHVVGTEPATAVLALAERAAGGQRVGAVVVRPHAPTVVPQATEDKDGIVDLPPRRVVAGAALGAALGLAVGVLIGLLVGSGVAPAVVIGGFAAVVGGVIGAVAGGGARYGSERATMQPQAAGEDITIVAAFFDDELDAAELARTVAAAEQQYDMRIVGIDGRWHVPPS